MGNNESKVKTKFTLLIYQNEGTFINPLKDQVLGSASDVIFTCMYTKKVMRKLYPPKEVMKTGENLFYEVTIFKNNEVYIQVTNVLDRREINLSNKKKQKFIKFMIKDMKERNVKIPLNLDELKLL